MLYSRFSSVVTDSVRLHGIADSDRGDSSQAAAATKLQAPKIALVLGEARCAVCPHRRDQDAGGARIVRTWYGTSAGSVVGRCMRRLQRLRAAENRFSAEQESVGDWVLPDRGFIKGEMLQNFINKALQNRPMNA